MFAGGGCAAAAAAAAGAGRGVRFGSAFCMPAPSPRGAAGTVAALPLVAACCGAGVADVVADVTAGVEDGDEVVAGVGLGTEGGAVESGGSGAEEEEPAATAAAAEEEEAELAAAT